MKLLLVLLTVIITGCDYLPFSAGPLSGVVTAAPATWDEIASPDIIQIETNPADPYSVKLWIVGKGDKLYVHAGANRATWVEHLEVDPGIKVLIGEQLFELEATRVTSQEEFDAFANDYEAKYGSRPRNEDVGEAYLFALR